METEEQYDEIKVEFKNWFGQAVKIDDAQFEIVQRSYEKIEEVLIGNPYPKTLSVLHSFIARLNFLKNGVTDLCESDNLYAARVVYRSFLEHWLTATFIWTRFVKENSDEPGNDYVEFGSLDETIMYGKSVKKTAEILGIAGDDRSVWEALIEKFPQFAQYSQAHVKSKVEQFRYITMINYLRENKGPASDWVHIIISEYSELSSFVHGGAQTASQYVSVKERHEEYKGMIRFVFNMCRAFALSVVGLMTVYDEKKFIPIVQGLGQIPIVE